jgi:Tfp pilus assembly protein PilN
MPQINLLTTASSKKKKVKALESPSIELTKVTSAFLPFFYLTIAILVFIWLILSFVVIKDKKELALLEKKRSSLSASPKEISEINQKKEQLTKKSLLLDDLSSVKFFWAEKLARIAEFIPDGIWLTEISLDRINLPSSEAKKEKDSQPDKYVLKLRGCAFAYKIQDAVTLIGEFNNLLKADEKFFKDFSEITLKNVAKSSIAKTDIMNFEFNLFLR